MVLLILLTNVQILPMVASVNEKGCPLIYLAENGVTMVATEDARDSIGKIVFFKGMEVEIISDWNHMKV